MLSIDAVSGEQRRRTDYRGSVWFGQRPETGARRIVAPGARYLEWEGTAFFLPDSLPYRRAELADAQVSCSAAIQASHLDYHFVMDAHASWADDPRGGEFAGCS